jgi:hypothetical protein
VVPLSDGSTAPIEHLGVDEFSKTLGSMTCPSGCNKGALKYMTQKASNWKDMIQVGKLSRRYVWFMMRSSSGLGCRTAYVQYQLRMRSYLSA